MDSAWDTPNWEATSAKRATYALLPPPPPAWTKGGIDLLGENIEVSAEPRKAQAGSG
jgi:hypothetical protein